MAFSFQGTFLKILNQDVLVVVVKKYVIDNPFERDKMISIFNEKFPNHEIVLMAQSFGSNPVYYGNTTILNTIAKIPLNQLTWYKYDVR